jgi:SAM-dependent methyltransferase
VANAVRLEFPEASFDLVHQSTVFSSILDADVRMQIAREMLRVLKPGGSVLWYDFFVKNPRNLDVQGMSKKEILRLFPNCDVILRRVTLAPPLARALAPRSWLLGTFLTMLRILNTHYLALVRPRGWNRRATNCDRISRFSCPSNWR